MKISPRARSVLARMAAEGPLFAPMPSQRLYITQAGLVRAGLAEWTTDNKVQITAAGRALLEEGKAAR